VAVVLAALWSYTRMQPVPEDAEPYHARVRAAAAALPLNVGDWIGRDVPLDPGAMRMLKPNVTISRLYSNPVTGQSVNFLLVHCRDARSMLGHYPPACYPNTGWEQRSASPCEALMGGIRIPQMQYEFRRPNAGRTEEQIVYDMMILPDGHIVRDMDGLRASAKSYRRQFFGAAQLQLVFTPDTPEEERQEIIAQFMQASRRLIETIEAGVQS
jgi:hypothetical protein